MKATEQFIPMALFIVPYRLVLGFESVDEIPKGDHPNQSCETILSCGVICFLTFSKTGEIQDFLKLNLELKGRSAAVDLLHSFFNKKSCKIWLSLRMFLFHLIHFLTFLVKSQPQRSYKKKSVTDTKKSYFVTKRNVWNI